MAGKVCQCLRHRCGTVCWWAFLACVCLNTLGSSLAFTQGDKPDLRLVVHTGGCEQRVKTVRFSPDSTQLYAAGNDKRVYVWNLLPDRGGHLFDAVPIEPIFWEVSRGHRGVIENFELSKSGKLAVCGTGARGYGDILLFDVAQRTALGAFPNVRGAVPNEENEHVSSVLDVEWSPKETLLASADTTGRVHVWNTVTRQTIHTDDVDGLSLTPRPICFLNDTSLLVSLVTNPGGRVAVLDLSQKAPKLRQLEVEHIDQVLAIAAIAALPGAEFWVSSDRGQNLHFWKGLTKSQTISLAKPQNIAEKGRLAASLHTAGKNGRYLLVNVHVKMKDEGPDRSELQIWDVLGEVPKFVDSVLIPGPAGLTAAISPDELLVAGVDDGRNAVHLYELNKNGTFLKDAAGNPRHVMLKGTASQVAEVAFSNDNNFRVRFSTDANPTTNHILNLKAAGLENGRPLPQEIWRNSQIAVDNWKVQVSVDGANLGLIQNGVLQGTIPLDVQQQGLYSTHAWITDEAGRQTRAIAMGTKLFGIYIYSLPVNGKCRLLRYFRDHSDRIRTLSVSHQSRYLASGSNDATIKIWSLEALFPPQASAPESSAWGCTFLVTNQGLQVTQVVPGGIAAARGMVANDILTRVESTKPHDTAPAMLQAIQSAALWEQLVITTQREKRRITIVPGWEPMLSFILDQNSEWAAWTPRGYYSASASGDKLFGWVENPIERGGTPQFFLAKAKRGDFEQPKVISDLFVGIVPPEPPPPKKLPVVRIIRPKWGDNLIPNKPFDIEAEVVFPDAHEKFKVEVLANLSPVEKLDKQDLEPGVVRYTGQGIALPLQETNRVLIRALYRDTHSANSNHVDVVSYARTGPKIDPHIENKTTIVDIPTNLEKPRLFLAGIAIGQGYDNVVVRGIEINLKLDAPVKDIVGITGVLFQHPGRLYDLPQSTPLLLTDKAVTRQGFRDFVKGIKKQMEDAKVKPSDFFVLAVSGHGKNLDDNYHFVINKDVVTKQDGIPWFPSSKTSDVEDTFQSLATLPCQKLLILDTCESGSALNPIPNFWNKPKRLFEATDSLILTACTDAEKAREHLGVSFFSSSFIEGCEGGVADGFGPNGRADGRIHLMEVAHFAKERIRKKVGPEADDPNLHHYEQNPQISGVDLARFANIALFKK